jgi:hypothetical protein
MELAIVLGVAGIIIGAIWSLSGTMYSDVEQEKFSELLNVIVSNVRGNYAGKAFIETTLVPTTGGVPGMMPILTSMNVFPGNTVHSVPNGTNGCAIAGGCSVVDSPFGEQSTTGLPAAGTPYNSIYVCGWNSLGSTRCTFTVATSTSNVPLFAIEALLSKGKNCINAAMMNSNPSTLAGLVGVYINGNPMTLPLTLSAASSAATGCEENAVNYVDFVFRLTP